MFSRSYASLNFLNQNWKVKNELLCFCLSTNLLFLFVCSGLRPEKRQGAGALQVQAWIIWDDVDKSP